MKSVQLYIGCLSEAAYYIQSGNEAAIIDPLRDPAPYLEMARKNGATIKYIFETHFHADFVSGHLDLAAATGARRRQDGRSQVELRHSNRAVSFRMVRSFR